VGIIAYTSYQFLHPQETEVQKAQTEIQKYSYEIVATHDFSNINSYGDRGCTIVENRYSADTNTFYPLLMCPK